MGLRRFLNRPDTAGVIAPPPLIYLSGWLLGWLLNKSYPIAWLPGALTWLLGAVLISCGVLCAASAFLAMRRARTPVDPYSPTTAIVSEGAYRYTRNPLYLALILLYIALAAIANMLWPLLLLPLVMLVLQRGVIAPEERYLEKKFGDAYLQYKAKVRRWF
ncbi:MAG TPA: methyltransferase [Gammaproteobacteria bacterium]|nr:methyltransferase [Gammaproteobacteria bacterium]